MNIIKLKLNLILLILILLLIGAFVFLQYPIPSYKKREDIDFSKTCNDIQNPQIKEHCLITIEKKDFNENEIIALIQELKIDLRRSCGLFKFGSAPYCLSEEKIEEFITNNEKPQIIPRVYYQALMENPFFCDKIPLDILELDNLNLQRRECYLDMSIIWKDDFLCQKLKNIERDFCYLMLVMENYK